MKSIPELSVDSRLLHQALEKVPQGSTITYAELSALIGRDVQGAAYGNLTTARNKARKAMCVFEAVINVGLKRLTDAEIPSLCDKMTDGFHRESGRTIKKLGCILDFESLPRDVQTKQNTALSMAGMLHHVTKPSQIAKVARRVEEITGHLAVAKTLELFK